MGNTATTQINYQVSGLSCKLLLLSSRKHNNSVFLLQQEKTCNVKYQSDNCMFWLQKITKQPDTDVKIEGRVSYNYANKMDTY